MQTRLRQFSILGLLVLVTLCAFAAKWYAANRDYLELDMDRNAILSMPTKGFKDSGQFWEVNPQETALDRVLHERCLKFAELSADDRAKVKASLSRELSARLRAFAYRCNIFALRRNDPDRLRAGLIAYAMCGGAGGPRDTSTALARMHHVAHHLGMDMEVFSETATLSSGHVADLMNRAKNWDPDFHEAIVTTDAGIGFVDKGDALYEPEYDLLSVSRKIAEKLEEDHYQVRGFEIAAKDGILFWFRKDDLLEEAQSQVTGTVELTCVIDESVATYQSFRLHLSELGDPQTVRQLLLHLENATTTFDQTVSYWIGYGKVICIIRTKNYLVGGTTFETRESLERFHEPILRILKQAQSE